jgi:hypothetical protein
MKTHGLEIELGSNVTGYGIRWFCKLTNDAGAVVLDAHDFAKRSHALFFARRYASLHLSWS